MSEKRFSSSEKTVMLIIVLLQALFSSTMLSAQESLAFLRAAWHSTSVDYDHTAHLATDGELSTSWISKPGDREWIYIDLGNKCNISGITIYWGAHFAEAFEILVS